MNIKTPLDALNKAFLKVKPTYAEIENFKKHLQNYFHSLDTNQSEENNKIILRDFLLSTHFGGYDCNVSGRIDLTIKEKSSTQLQVLFELKRLSNRSEMITDDNPNRKAMQEMVYYYLQEFHTQKNTSLKHCIITDYHTFYVFDALEFYKNFGKNTSLKNEFLEFESKGASGNTTDYFYSKIASKYLDSLEITCTKFTLEEYKNATDKKLIELFKILSPEHLLKLPFANDSNTLNTKFYSELLHIIGLEERPEAKGSSKKIITRKEIGKRNNGSLLENCIHNLLETNELDDVPQLEKYGETEEEIVFSVALELCIVWINRILFLKLLEGQLVAYNNNDPKFRFLNIKCFPEFDSLKGLFFGILARQSRSSKYAGFDYIPYLNSSLFEPTPLEQSAIQISNLSDNLKIPILSDTVLKDVGGATIRGEKNTLEYLYEFLDAYDFSSNATEVIASEKKTLINASVLGLIFEKINGYKDGSFFTPGFITMYMCRETIERAIVQRFSERIGVPFATVTELANYLSRTNYFLLEANEIFNSITICDPAVGSGHFLVSSLNELIALKYRLNILIDRNGRHISNQAYEIIVENDELIVLDENRNLFQYNKDNKESQRIQETMFHEKQTLIERCLFGVDINENSVKICRLRLWIELLKYAYYRTDGSGLETLPNLDINIKTGNSLLSRFPIDINLQEGLKHSTHGIDGYKNAVMLYKHAPNKKAKDEYLAIINQCKSEIRLAGEERHPMQVRLDKATQELHSLNTQTTLLERSAKEQKEYDKAIESLDKTITSLRTEITNWKEKKQFANAFEWRFEFPEVLDDDGNFIGFDIIIGNPPYIQLQKDGGTLGKLYEPLAYTTFASMGDIYMLFMEKGFTLVKSNGVVCMIVSNKWMRAGYGEKLRLYLANKQGLRLLDLGPGIFDSATVDTCIYIGANEVQQRAFSALTVNKGEDIATSIEQRAVQFAANPSGDSWVIMNPIEQQIKQKIEQYGTPLKDWDINIYRGVLTGYNEAFIIDGATKDRLIAEDPKNAEIIKPILRGRDIKRYKAEFADLWMIFTAPALKIDIEEYPSIKEYLLTFGFEKLRQDGIRDEKGNLVSRKKSTNKWFELQDQIAYYEEFEKEKIVWAETDQNLNLAFANRGMYLQKTCFMIITNTPKYLMSSLNSKLVDYQIRKTSSQLGEKGLSLTKESVITLPIPQISEEEQKPFEELVDIILTKKERNEDTTAEERRIDEMVYSLYHLTPDEITHIEGKE
jgi:adenine-specific DNA-methyltransferase